jgi:hypothetical protein
MMRRGPGLVGVAARTAVFAGTATAVSGRVARRQQAKFAQKDAEAAAAAQAQQPVYEEAAEATPMDDTAAQLQQLAALKDQGILTEEEFAAKKKQILGI